MQHFDVGIIGGGLVGASLARLLSKLQITTLVLDKSPAESLYAANLDNRGLALAATSANILQKNIPIWDQLVKYSFPIKSIHVSEQNSFGFTKIDAAKYNIPALGYVVSASALGTALIRDLEQLPYITVMRPAIIQSVFLNTQQQTWELAVEEQKIQVKLLVAADGSDSFLRSMNNIQVNTRDFQQSAIVTNIKTQLNSKQIAFERFTPEGVLALLPFGDSQMKCVWTIENSKLPMLHECTDQEFLQAVQAAIGYRLGKLFSVSERKIFPIKQIIADQIYASSTVLIGNAANTLHPVAAQGFNLGLRDAVCLAEVLKNAKARELQINDMRILAEYADARKADHSATLKHTCSLVDTFASKNTGTRIIRRLGLIAAQVIPQLNQRITEQGLGICRS